VARAQKLRAVADSDALILILDQDLEHLLERAFIQLLLPYYVEEELRRGGRRRRAQLARLIARGPLKRCTDYPVGVVLTWQGMLRARRSKRGQWKTNLGEAEGLAQCQSQKVSAILTHDRAAARLARNLALEVLDVPFLLANYGDR
jgi:predicted nucleic acid-binding protein